MVNNSIRITMPAFHPTIKLGLVREVKDLLQVPLYEAKNITDCIYSQIERSPLNYGRELGFKVEDFKVDFGELHFNMIHKALSSFIPKKVIGYFIQISLAEDLNLHDLLKDCIGMNFYMPHYGTVKLSSIAVRNMEPSFLVFTHGELSLKVFEGGKYDKNGEVCVFPSKEQRDWSLFEPPYMPNKLDRVWVKRGDETWVGRYFVDYVLNEYRCFADQKDRGQLEPYDECKPINQIPW